MILTTRSWKSLSQKTKDQLLSSFCLTPRNSTSSSTARLRMLDDQVHYVILAKQYDKLVGVAYITKTFSLGQEQMPQAMFYVLPEHRRKGIASALLNRTCSFLKRRKYKQVNVSAWDQASSSFYEKHNCSSEKEDRFKYNLFNLVKDL